MDSLLSLLPITATGHRRQGFIRLGCIAMAVVGHLIALGGLGASGARSPLGRDFVESGLRRSVAIRLLALSDASLEKRAAHGSESVSKLTSVPDGTPAATEPNRVPPTWAANPGRQRPPSFHSATGVVGAPIKLAEKESLEPILTSAFDPSIKAFAAAAHFYTFDEVEVPAAPVADWELDAATLDNARIARIVFDLFVGDDGTVVACNIVEPPELDDTLRTSIEGRLRSTVLMPAVRTGRPVDSVRRIELTVS